MFAFVHSYLTGSPVFQKKRLPRYLSTLRPTLQCPPLCVLPTTATPTKFPKNSACDLPVIEDAVDATPSMLNTRTRDAFCFELLSDARPDLSAEWHFEKNSSVRIEDTTTASRTKVWWCCCMDSLHEWMARVSDRVIGKAPCPICACSGKYGPSNYFRRHTTYLTHPKYSYLVAEWHPRNDEWLPALVPHGSNRFAWWRCARQPEHEWIARVSSRTVSGAGCPYCASVDRKKTVARATLENFTADEEWIEGEGYDGWLDDCVGQGEEVMEPF